MLGTYPCFLEIEKDEFMTFLKQNSTAYNATNDAFWLGLTISSEVFKQHIFACEMNEFVKWIARHLILYRLPSAADLFILEFSERPMKRTLYHTFLIKEAIAEMMLVEGVCEKGLVEYTLRLLKKS